MKRKPLRFATGDFETTGFKTGRKPEPFAAGFFDGITYHSFWGKTCIQQWVDFIEALDEPLMIYFHNGGRFDFYYLLEHLEQKRRIINARIVQAYIGKHELRDSWKILPFKLSDYKKDYANYDWFEHNIWPKHKREIDAYLKGDCVYLYDLVAAFHRRFGPRLTVGGAAMKELKARHPFDVCTWEDDATYRKFYYGGRTQCFESGIIERSLVYVDMNSAYSKVMRDLKHPLNLHTPVPEIDTCIRSDTVFAVVEAENYGALPMRLDRSAEIHSRQDNPLDGSLSFDIERGVFWTTLHEIQAGLDTNTLKILKVRSTYNFKNQSTLADFIDHYQEQQLIAERNGDGADRAACKVIKNSAYGKLAQNPESYRDFVLSIEPQMACKKICKTCTLQEYQVLEKCWRLETAISAYKGEAWFIHSRPAKQKFYLNVAMAASITGGCRALLLRGLANAVRPVYCDTDSIICTAFSGEIDKHRLGAWKIEATGNRLAIAGKKVYAFSQDGKCIKHASKGGILLPGEIESIASGLAEFVDWHSPAPNFKIDGSHGFVHREIRNTAKPGRVPTPIRGIAAE